MPALSFQSVSKTYPARQVGAAAFKALDQVSFDVQEGEFLGLLGPNGAGKTTLISTLAGLTRPSTGRVLVHGHDVQTDYAAARRILGVVPQELVFDPFFTVRESLRIQSGYFGVKKNDDWIDELLDSLGLADKAGSNMRQLSGGMKRRVLVAQALVHKPRVIVLDEPTAGVDVELRQTLWQFIAKLNKQGHTVCSPPIIWKKPKPFAGASPCSNAANCWPWSAPLTCCVRPPAKCCASSSMVTCRHPWRRWPV